VTPLALGACGIAGPPARFAFPFLLDDYCVDRDHVAYQ